MASESSESDDESVSEDEMEPSSRVKSIGDIGRAQSGAKRSLTKSSMDICTGERGRGEDGGWWELDGYIGLS